MSTGQLFAGTFLSLVCCIVPISALWFGVFIGRYGGIGGAVGNILDRLGVPRGQQ